MAWHGMAGVPPPLLSNGLPGRHLDGGTCVWRHFRHIQIHLICGVMYSNLQRPGCDHPSGHNLRVYVPSHRLAAYEVYQI